MDVLNLAKAMDARMVISGFWRVNSSVKSFCTGIVYIDLAGIYRFWLIDWSIFTTGTQLRPAVVLAFNAGSMLDSL
jgi:hypothetical protein